MDERLGIAGSGTIACGLAKTAAEHGDVVLWARSEQSAERARAKAGGATVTTDFDALGEATYLVEAVSEEPEVKNPLLERLAGVASDRAIVASTTSSLSVTTLSEFCAEGRFLGLHVFNPVPKMQLVELVFPDAATQETRDRSFALCEAWGKTPVEVPDVPGFVVNRLLFPYLFSAVRLMDETGIAPEAIDTCMKLGAGHPMGPIALLDFVGLDVSAAIADEIGTEVPQRVRDLVAEGRLGRKSGQGLLDWSR
jgi:3-hydroxybutyryl-CoA dehydrogenase